jgi:drug/metabolite transporter (DMT)-like permease
MSVQIGIALSFVAMLCWGLGDFWIQKSTRKIGVLESLFFITAFGVVVLLPFVYKNLPGIFTAHLETIAVIGLLCVVLLLAAVLDFEALRVGKLAVVEPIWSFEVPVAALLAFFILGERVTFFQTFLIAVLLFGLVLVSLRDKIQISRVFLERGAVLAFFGAVFMGASNFFMGWGSRLSDPVMANFLSDLFIALVTGGILLFTGRFKNAIRDMFSNKQMLLQMSVSDKTAWLAFAFAMSLAPIAIATALSESYIIIAVILGLAVNKEKIKPHQKVGLIVAIIAAVVLAATTS